eukprot:scaffold154647_cov52-Attheya_sp.AAC.1
MEPAASGPQSLDVWLLAPRSWPSRPEEVPSLLLVPFFHKLRLFLSPGWYNSLIVVIAVGVHSQFLRSVNVDPSVIPSGIPSAAPSLAPSTTPSTSVAPTPVSSSLLHLATPSSR